MPPAPEAEPQSAAPTNPETRRRRTTPALKSGARPFRNARSRRPRPARPTRGWPQRGRVNLRTPPEEDTMAPATRLLTGLGGRDTRWRTQRDAALRLSFYGSPPRTTGREFRGIRAAASKPRPGNMASRERGHGSDPPVFSEWDLDKLVASFETCGLLVAGTACPARVRRISWQTVRGGAPRWRGWFEHAEWVLSGS